MEGNVGHPENHLEQYTENAMVAPPVRHDGLTELQPISISHSTQVIELQTQQADTTKRVAALEEQLQALQNEVIQLKHKVSTGQRVHVSQQQQSMSAMMDLEIPPQNGPLPALASAPPNLPATNGSISNIQTMSHPLPTGANNLQQALPPAAHNISQEAGNEQYPPNSVQFDGLITLGHAAEHAASDVMQNDQKGLAGRKRAMSTPSLQLELDEEDVIEELRARGLITEEPDGDPKAFRGGRPPLGMGPYKRVKEMYDKRMITMESWRIYYADKCRQSGYDGAFRKDLRPRLNHRVLPSMLLK